jgi:hypothetical protein
MMEFPNIMNNIEITKYEEKCNFEIDECFSYNMYLVLVG